MDTRYRLYTEEKPNLRELVSAMFRSYTMFPAEGVWEGHSENSAVIELIGEKADAPMVARLAERIRVTNDQTAVLVTAEPVQVIMVTATSNPDIDAALVESGVGTGYL